MFGSYTRADLERLVIAACWGSAAEAKDLTKFPSEAWMREAHRAIISVIRGLLADGNEVNDLLVGFRLKESAPEHMEEFRRVHDFFAHELGSIGGARATLLKKFSEEYSYQLTWEAMSLWSRSMRTMPFADWYRGFHSAIQALAPTTDEVDRVRSFDQVYLDRIESRIKGETESGCRTRIPELDRVLKGGPKPGQMILVVGASGTGKTVLAWQIATNQSAHEEKVAFFQLEMSEDEMADRAICMATGRELEELREAELAAARVNAKYLRHLYLYADHASLDDYLTNVDAHMYKHPDTQILVTDYMGLLVNHRAGGNTTSAINETSAACKKVAKVHRVPHIVNQQPSRKYLEDRKPSLEHVRDSGKIVDDAHAVLFLHYPHKFDRRMPRNYTEIHVLKNRGGRAGAVVPIEWTPEAYTMRPWRDEIPTPGSSRKKKNDGPDFDGSQLPL